MREDVDARRETPMWRQALEGIGLVVVISALVALTGLAVSLAVSLLF